LAWLREGGVGTENVRPICDSALDMGLWSDAGLLHYGARAICYPRTIIFYVPI